MRFSMLLPAALLLAGVALPLPLAAQAMVQPLPGTTDADKLADLVRQLGRSPRDLSALIEAGDLSAKLGDTTAAAALYKRASQIDPGNARVKAGIARILVNGEHPGEALRYFEQAERSGLAPAMYADDRGLAYDLIGEQERAQRDYRLALARPGQDNEDEVRRRYALSLGISGRKDEALQQIDALLRKSDRGAWRARAFILAMNGDASGADRIATTMMPAGMATGLAAFFARLPTLSPADRAFAVHFGEVSPTPERLADARLVPALPVLGPDPSTRPAPVQVAAQTATPARNARDRRGRDARQSRATSYADRGGQRPTPSIGSSAPSSTATQTPPSIGAPTQVAQATQSAGAVRPPAAVAPVVAATRSAPVGLASNVSTPPSSSGASTTVLAAARPVESTTTVTPQPAAAANLAVAAETRTLVPGTPNPVALAATSGAAAPAATSAADANNVVRALSAASTGTVQVASVAAPLSPTTRPSQVAAAVAAPATPPHAESGDSILARIVANISIPASELGVAPMPGATPQPGTTTTLDEAAVAAERNAAAAERRRDVAAAERPAASTHARREPVQTAQAEQPAVAPRRRGASADPVAAEASTPATTRRSGRGAAKQVAQAEATDDAVAATTRRNARAGKKGADAEVAATGTKKPATKTKADAKALADRKAAADEKKAARAEPERYWIQVAGGATQGDLKKAWIRTKEKSSLLAGRTGYSTPLRATNRVVTGPFKTQAEAQAMVNKLSKEGVSAFTFTSAAGQKMTKLDGK